MPTNAKLAVPRQLVALGAQNRAAEGPRPGPMSPPNQGRGKIQLAVLAILNEHHTWLDTHELTARVYAHDFTGHEFVTHSQLSTVGGALQSLTTQYRVVARRGPNRTWWATPKAAARFEASNRGRDRGSESCHPSVESSEV